MKKRKNQIPSRTSHAANRVSLPRALSKLGYSSRSQAGILIQEGKVFVNNRSITNPHAWVDLSKDSIRVNGEQLQQKLYRYVLFNKPKGVVTTRSDELGRMTIIDVLGEEAKELNPVGRLDKETSGLILLTNDHQLAELLTNPRSEMKKKYSVSLDRELDSAGISKLETGIDILVEGERYLTRPARAQKTGKKIYEVTIIEGKNRQVRKMVEALDAGVIDLRRLSIGPLQIGSLKEGKWRECTPEEIRELRALLESKRKSRKATNVRSPSKHNRWAAR